MLKGKLKYGLLSVAFLAGLALLGTGLMLILSGIGVLVAAGITGVVLLYLSYKAPAFVQYLEQMRLDSLSSVIRGNPIAAMRVQQNKDQELLDEARGALAELRGAIDLQRRTLEADQRNHPEDDLSSEFEDLHEQENILRFQIQEYASGEEALLERAKQIARYERKWNRAISSEKINKALGRKNFMEEFKKDTAIKAVEERSANAMARLTIARDVNYAREQIRQGRVSSIGSTTVPSPIKAKVELIEKETV